MTHKRVILFCCCLVLAAAAASPAAAQRDVTWVQTFNREFVNWATPHVATFDFPPADLYTEINCHVTIACPGPPGDCDPWDRFGNLAIRQYDSDTTYVDYEIVRFITPYDITFAGGPQSCGWVIDVTDYQFMLRDEVALVLFIDSWIGGDQGWLMTFNFEMISGTPEREPFAVEQLWRYSYLVYGDPDNPVEDHLTPVDVEVPASAQWAKFRAFSTGHGFYNTDNAAEFSYKWQEIHVDDNIEQHYLWRPDCEQNRCSPQLGTWEYDRAGWCPGDKAEAWDVEVTDWVTPGATSTFLFALQPYENWCRPNNPECVDSPGCECPGHAYYRVECQTVFYRDPDISGVDEENGLTPGKLYMVRNYPNPFHPSTTISYRLAEPGEVAISVYDVSGTLVRTLTRDHSAAGSFTWTWDGRNQAEQPMGVGVYLYEVRFGEERTSAKMLMVR